MPSGFRYGTEPEQFSHSKLIIAWGSNVLATNVHLWPFIVEARRNGARFYTIDPVLNRTGKLADKHFAIYPGSDLALALGLMHVIIGENLHDADYVGNYTQGFEALARRAGEYPPERVEHLTGIPREDVVSLAREYATTRPAAIRLNYGIQRSERGGSATRAIAVLPALIGSWREVGGGLQLSTSQAFRVNRTGLEMPELQRRSPLGREARIVNMAELGKALTQLNDPPVKAIVVYNSNPAAIAPNQNLVLQGMRREDLFTVVLEQFQNDSADHADIVLPSTTFLEHTDLYFAYGHYYLQLARPVLPAPGETKSNVEVFRLLAQRMGFDDACFADSEDDMIRTLLDSGHPFLQGITLERLEREHSVRLNVAPDSEPYLPFAHGGFGTPSGKCEFGAETLDYQAAHRIAAGRSGIARALSAGTGFVQEPRQHELHFRKRALRRRARRPHCFCTPKMRVRVGFEDGDRVRVFNQRGSCTFVAGVNGSDGQSIVRQGVVLAPSVRWNKLAPDHRNINALTSDRLTDIGGGPTFYSCLVDVEKCGD